MKSGLDHARVLLEKAGNDLRLAEIGLEPPLFTASQIWESVTPYYVTRHTKGVGAAEALSADIRAECYRRGLPEPHVTQREPRGVPGVGLVGDAHLTFKVAVEGSIILGKAVISVVACSLGHHLCAGLGFLPSLSDQIYHECPSTTA